MSGLSVFLLRNETRRVAASLPLLPRSVLPRLSSSPLNKSVSVWNRKHSSLIFHQWRQAIPVVGSRWFSLQSTSPRCFSELERLHPSSKRALSETMGFTEMTEIQSRTFDMATSSLEKDVLGRARTGTGKTVAFLLPAIETLLRNNDPDSIGVLIIAPTRELSCQIAESASSLLTFHPHLSCQVVYGGIPRGKDVQKMKKRIPSILVATPGRLQDHLESTNIRDVPFKSLFRNMRVLVLDEMDRLLDMGFREDVLRILSYLPKERQTMLFSATMPQDLNTILHKTMKKDYALIDCLSNTDQSTHVNTDHVDQSYVLLKDTDRCVSCIFETVQHCISQNPKDYKILVFFPTARIVSYHSLLFNEGLGKKVLEMHSRKSQEFRTHYSKRFRESQGKIIMFTTDVSARGVDYPNVTHVVQFGLPENRETYIHRLGRTARAGKRGKGCLVLMPFEKDFLKELDGLDLSINQELTQVLEKPMTSMMQQLFEVIQDRVRLGKDDALVESATDAYQSIVLFYVQYLKRIGGSLNKENLIRYANDFAFHAGLRGPPPMKFALMRDFGFLGVNGLNVLRDDDKKKGYWDKNKHKPRGNKRQIKSTEETSEKDQALTTMFAGWGRGGNKSKTGKKKNK